MQFRVLTESWLDSGWALPLLAIVGVAVLVWFLSWLFPARRPSGVSESLKGLEGLDERMARQLREFGIESDRDLIRLSPRGQQELKSQLGLHSGEYAVWREQIFRRWRRTYLPAQLRDIPDIYPDPELGALYSRKPAKVDSLAQLQGIDQLAADRIYSAGIYTLDQLRMLTSVQQANFKRRFKLDGFDFSQIPAATVEAAKTPVLAPSRQDTASVDSSGAISLASETELDAEIGELYVRAPSRQDDLTQLEDVDHEVAEKLNQGGVYTFEQLRALTPHQQIQFRKRFSMPWIDFESWKSTIVGQDDRELNTAQNAIHAGKAAANSIEPTAATSGIGDSCSTSREVATEPDEVIAPREVSVDLGYLYSSPPLKPDDLTRLAGITAEQARQLNSVGIYTFSQLRLMNLKQRKNLRHQFGLTELDFEQLKPALHPASATDTQTERTKPASTKVDDDLGRLYTSTPAKPDDLTRLQGIDATKASQMKAAGLYTFEQLKSLNAKQQSALRDRFGLDEVDFVDWQRCICAWERGISTESENQRVHPTGWLHSVRLPEIVPGVFDGQQLVAYPEQVVFRGSNPEHWGQDIQSVRAGVMRALPAASIRSDINYVRMRRVDTRQSVVTAVTKSQLFGDGPDDDNGWNGRCDAFFGGRHLGVFARDIPHEVEIRFGVGGWGFGHRFGHNDQQECGWFGRIISSTAFEISVGHIGSQSGTTLFCGSDPSIWNQHVRDGAERWAKPVNTVNHPIRFVRLLRRDTGEGVIVRADESTLLRRSENPRIGWNGANEHSTLR